MPMKKHVLSKVMIPETKRGWDQVVHGGILSTILDEIMAWTAIYFTKNIMMTTSMTTTYLKPVKTDKHVITAGWIQELKGPREAIMRAEIYNDKKQLCTEATGNYVLFSTKLAKRLKLMDEESLGKFKKFKEACL